MFITSVNQLHFPLYQKSINAQISKNEKSTNCLNWRLSENLVQTNFEDFVEALPDDEKQFWMAQIEEDDLKNYNLKRFDCEDPFFMEIFALKVDDAGYMVFPGHTLVCKERVCLGRL